MNRSARVALGFLIVSASASWFEIARLRYRVAELEQQGDRGEGVLGVLNTVLEDDLHVRRETKRGGKHCGCEAKYCSLPCTTCCAPGTCSMTQDPSGKR